MKNINPNSRISIAAILMLYVAVGALSPTMASDANPSSTNPHQATIDAATHEKALIDAQKELLKSKNELEKEQNPPFDENFGKKGSLTIEAGEADKFHVVARSAEAFQGAAIEISQIIQKEIPNTTQGPYFTLLTDSDRAAVPLFWSERNALDRLDEKIKSILPSAPPRPEALGTLSGVGGLLSQIAQFTQLFRTDKNVSFSTADGLPDELLLELIAVDLKEKVLYPAGSLDTLITSDPTSDFGKKLMNILARRNELANAGSKGAAVLTELDSMATRLVTADEATRIPYLLTVLRGELVDLSLTRTGRRSVSVKVIAKGGASMRTSSIWRSDRLYAAGGVVASYRLTFGNAHANTIKAGVITKETGFANIPLH